MGVEGGMVQAMNKDVRRLSKGKRQGAPPWHGEKTFSLVPRDVIGILRLLLTGCVTWSPGFLLSKRVAQ